MSTTAATPLPRTANGRARRQRIIDTAARLMYERGATATSIDEVLAASGSGKSQMYHYFRDRKDLLAAVIDHQTDRVLGGQPGLVGVATWADLLAWADDLAALHRTAAGALACPLGSLAAELHADTDLRAAAAAAFARWLAPLATAMATLQAAGEIEPTADPGALATRTLAALQGALLLASTLDDPGLVGDVLLAHLETLRARAADDGAAGGLAPVSA